MTTKDPDNYRTIFPNEVADRAAMILGGLFSGPAGAPAFGKMSEDIGFRATTMMACVEMAIGLERMARQKLQQQEDLNDKIVKQ